MTAVQWRILRIVTLIVLKHCCGKYVYDSIDQYEADVHWLLEQVDGGALKE